MGSIQRIGRSVKITRLTGGDLHLQFVLFVTKRSESGSYTPSIYWRLWLVFWNVNSIAKFLPCCTTTLSHKAALFVLVVGQRLNAVPRLSSLIHSRKSKQIFAGDSEQEASNNSTFHQSLPLYLLGFFVGRNTSPTVETQCFVPVMISPGKSSRKPFRKRVNQEA